MPTDRQQHIVQYSGGIGSWAAAMRVAERHGVQDLTLLVADSHAEHPDLWRFVRQSCECLGVAPVIVADGRDPWQVFLDERFLGNSRLAPCSAALKQNPCRRWVEANAVPDPERTILYVGFDDSERRRIAGAVSGWAPWRVEFPMCEEPYLTKEQMLAWCRTTGVEPPALYAWADHNNCAGACVRAGQRHWAKVLIHAPQTYAMAERREEEVRLHLGKDVAILRERRGGVSRPLTLTTFRHRLQGANRSDREMAAGIAG